MKCNFIIKIALGMMALSQWTACGVNTTNSEVVADSTATSIVADKHSEAYIRQRIDTIYSHVDQRHINLNLDSAFCTFRYNALLEKASQISEKTGFQFLGYNHWIMGQDVSPEWTYDTKKIDNMTDSTAVVEMDIRNFGRHNYVTLELKFERNNWYVDDFVSYDDNRQNKYSEIKAMEDFIRGHEDIYEKGQVFTGYWGWVYSDGPELLLRLVMTDKGLECTECTIYRLHSYEHVKVNFDGTELNLIDVADNDEASSMGEIRLKLKLDDIGDLTGECYVNHSYLKEPYDGTITLRKDFFYYRDMPARKVSDYAE